MRLRLTGFLRGLGAGGSKSGHSFENKALFMKWTFNRSPHAKANPAKKKLKAPLFPVDLEMLNQFAVNRHRAKSSIKTSVEPNSGQSDQF